MIAFCLKKWFRSPAVTTSKIRLVTRLHGKDPMRAVLDRLIKTKFIVDTSSLNPMLTEPKSFGRKLYKYRFDFVDDSIIILSGKWAKSPSSDPLNPTPRLEWKEIVKLTNDDVGSHEYEVMTILAQGIRSESIFYNK